MKLTKNIVTSLLLGLAASGFTQGGIDVTGDPVRVGGDLHQNTSLGGGQDQGGGQIVVTDDQDPLRQQPPAQTTSNRDEEAHKRLDGHGTEIAALRTDLDNFIQEEGAKDRAAFRGNTQAYGQARVRSDRARHRLQARGVPAQAFNQPRLLKELLTALEKGKFDKVLKDRLNSWLLDPKTTLGRMFAAYQDHEKVLYGDKDNPTDDMAYRLENLEKWATTDQTLPFEPSKNYAATSTAPPAADTTPSAPADKGTSKPQGGTVPGEQAPPALKPQGGKNDESKQGLLPLGLPQSESAALIVVVGMISYGLITRRKRPAQ